MMGVFDERNKGKIDRFVKIRGEFQEADSLRRNMKVCTTIWEELLRCGNQRKTTRQTALIQVDCACKT